MGSSADLAKAFNDAFGDDAGDAPLRFLNTGYPPLNKIISGIYDGGLAYGRLYEMFGESSTGKTALATQWMVEAQRLGGIAVFVDWERSFNVEMAKSLGLNVERPHFIRFRPRTWEEGNVKATQVCKLVRQSGAIDKTAPIFVVFDSIAAAIPQSQAEKEIDEYTMNDTTALARVTSTTLKAQAQHAEDFDAIFLYLNQMRLKPGVVYGDPRTTPGGKAMEFYASARMALGRQKIMEKTGSDKEFVGQQISIQCVKSKFTKPFSECGLRLMFDDSGIASFDTTMSLVEHMIDKGLLPYSKPRLTWTDGKQYFAKSFAEKVRSEGLLPELVKMLPA